MQISAAQRHRMNRVINFARVHFADELDLDTLADVACFSKYHFTRVFSSYFRETPIELLYRLRLERSTHNLVYFPNKRITDVAFDCGFSSLQTYSRAFRQRYGISPRCFRSANQWRFDRFPRNQLVHLEFKDPAVMAPISASNEVSVRIEARPKIRVAYIRHIGPYFDVNGSISATYEALEQWALRHGVWCEDSVVIGICPVHPAVTPARSCQYDACIPIPDEVKEDDVVSVQTIPGGTYAVLYVKCLSGQMNGAWEWFTSCWLPDSGASRVLSLSYEVYPPKDGKPGRPESGVELCMPIASA